MTTATQPLPLTFFAPPERLPVNELGPAVQAVRANPMLPAILDAYPDLAMILNEHRQIVHGNRALLKALGVSVEDVLGQRPGEVVGCTYSHALPAGCGTSQNCASCGAVNAILGSIQKREQVTGECQILVKSPTGPRALEIEATATPLVLDGMLFVILAGRDVSGAKRRAALERTFFHDTLNLAGGIQAITRLVVEEESTDLPRHLQQLEIMTRQLVEQIRAQRELAQAETGELRTRPKPVSAKGIMEDVRATYQYHPVAAGRIIRCIPPALADLELHTDPVLLARTLGNLVKNALEASSPGEAVTMSCELVAGGTVVFAVHNPASMPRAVQMQVFRRSFSTKGGTGRGLGTFSVKLLTERYLKGAADFAVDPEHGTTFYLRLPRGAPAPAVAPGPTLAQVSKTAGALAGLRLLLADDDNATRRLMEVRLHKVGAEIVGASDGQAAVEAVTASQPGEPAFDVIVLDLEMPRLTGTEAAVAIRALKFEGPVIALSAHDAEVDGPRCMAAGCTAYLEKPVDLDALIVLINKCLRDRDR
jgi:CheY-like chemotaxis protein